jgi:hypothetical protein
VQINVCHNSIDIDQVFQVSIPKHVIIALGGIVVVDLDLIPIIS